MSFLYLASPYSHADAGEREARYVAALRKTAELMLAGEVVFSPIVHTHHVERITGPQSHDFWLNADMPILERAARLVVLRIPGWNLSRGVAAEIDFADEHDIPVEFIDP